MSRPSSRSYTPISQGRNGFSASNSYSEGDRDSPFSDASAHNFNINHSSIGNPNEIRTFVNYHSTAPGYPSFSTTSPHVLGSNAPNEAKYTSMAFKSQLDSLPRPSAADQSAQRSFQANYIPFPGISTSSDCQIFSPDTPIPMVSSPHVWNLEDSKQALSNSPSSQAKSASPQVHFGHSRQPSHLPSTFTQPWPHGPPPSHPPYTSSSFDQPCLPNGAAVTAYLGEAVWRPSMGMYGVPATEEKKGYYVRKICLSLVNLYDLWDDPKDVLTFAVKFADTGIWSDAKDIETIAHIVVNNAMRIHNFGVTGVAFRRSAEFESLNAEDMDLTFPQRIHYLARLFYHSKVAADNVMSGRDVAKYVALPITSLRRLPFFEEEWSRMSQVDRAVQTEIVPYPDGLKHPSPTEREQLSVQVATLPSLVNDYMVAGGHLATFRQKHLSPNELAYAALLSFQQASHKRPMDRDQGSEVEPAAKRFRTSEHIPFDSNVRNSGDEEND
ncbi:hypothetical protein AG0111_0g9664 [Alternaria gaisen]|uniref:Uncharacterized protein n=1 Tax=Alternaria gaisen TaxID=167740 RepID=A0ACB6FDE1_9PLEO|nr:hypothetical protein AG0111_0g9664 [Alternaria gaisen]